MGHKREVQEDKEPESVAAQPLELFLPLPSPFVLSVPRTAVSLTQSLQPGGWLRLRWPPARNQTPRPNLAVCRGVTGPSPEHSPSRTSQSALQRPDGLDVTAALRLSHQENPASCPSDNVVIQGNVVHLCVRLPDFISLLVTPSHDGKKCQRLISSTGRSARRL